MKRLYTLRWFFRLYFMKKWFRVNYISLDLRLLDDSRVKHPVGFILAIRVFIPEEDLDKFLIKALGVFDLVDRLHSPENIVNERKTMTPGFRGGIEDRLDDFSFSDSQTLEIDRVKSPAPERV